MPTFTLMAAFRPGSRCSEPAATKVVTCSSTLSCTLGGVRGKTKANSCMAMLTTSVAGGSGNVGASSSVPVM